MKKIIPLFIISIFYISGFAQNSVYRSDFFKNTTQKDNSKIQLKIYPNPCKQEKVTIEFVSHEIAEVGLTNIAGKEVMLKKFQFSENKKQIQLTDIPNGIYLIRIKTTDDNQVVKKLILARE